MLGNPWEHFRRWDGNAMAAEFDTQYSLLTSTYDNMSVRDSFGVVLKASLCSRHAAHVPRG